MPFKCPADNHLQFLHLEWLGNKVIGPFLGDSDTESAWELFASEEGSEAKEQKVGLHGHLGPKIPKVCSHLPAPALPLQPKSNPG